MTESEKIQGENNEPLAGKVSSPYCSLAYFFSLYRCLCRLADVHYGLLRSRLGDAGCDLDPRRRRNLGGLSPLPDPPVIPLQSSLRENPLRACGARFPGHGTGLGGEPHPTPRFCRRTRRPTPPKRVRFWILAHYLRLVLVPYALDLLPAGPAPKLRFPDSGSPRRVGFWFLALFLRLVLVPYALDLLPAGPAPKLRSPDSVSRGHVPAKPS